MGLTDKIHNWARQLVLDQSASTIRGVIKKGRLTFVSNKELLYTDKQGIEKRMTWGDFVVIVLGAYKLQNAVWMRLDYAKMMDLIAKEAKKTLREEYEKTKAYTGGLKER